MCRNEESFIFPFRISWRENGPLVQSGLIIEYISQPGLSHKVISSYRMDSKRISRSSLWGSMVLTERGNIPFCLTSNKRRGFSFLLNFSQLIHRDLAARNVLLGDKLQCKITDFGMARDLGLGDGIYARKTNVSSGRRDITRSNNNLLLYLFICLFIYSGNRTEWNLIRSVIIRVINKIGQARRGSPICSWLQN